MMNRQERIKALKQRELAKVPKPVDGKPGDNGLDGYTPKKDVDYFDGKDGRDGVDGEDGLTPIKGKDYFDGKSGKAGADGKKGETGLDGKKGVIWRGNWITQVKYNVDDAVHSFGSAYICIEDHRSSNANRPPTGNSYLTYWSVLAERGESGPGGSAGAQGSPGPANDATTTAKGAIKLANDLGGTADLPTVVATHLSSPLPINQGGTGSATDTHVLKSGDTMGGVLAMGTNKITGLANGTLSTDAAAFGQIPTALPPNGTASGDLSGSYPNPTVAKINAVAYNADPLTQYAALAPGSSARNVIQPTGASIIPTIIKGASSQSADLTQWQDSSAVILTTIKSDGKLVFGPSGSQDTNLYRSGANALITDDIFSSLHLIGNGTAPTIAANAGAGTSPTVSLTGHDTAGQISITTGTLPTLSADVFTVTFNTGYASAPYVNFSPANAVTALLSGASMVYVTATTATFKFTAGTTPLTAATTYLWNYSVIG